MQINQCNYRYIFYDILIQRLIELTRPTTIATTTGPQSAVTDEEKYTPVIASSPVIESSPWIGSSPWIVPSPVIESPAAPAASLSTYSGSSIYDQLTSTVIPPLLAPWLSPNTFAMVKIENDASLGNTFTPLLMPLMPSPVTVGSRSSEVPPYTCRSSEVPPYTRRGDHQYPQKHFMPRGVQVRPVTRNKGDYKSFDNFNELNSLILYLSRISRGHSSVT